MVIPFWYNEEEITENIEHADGVVYFNYYNEEYLVDQKGRVATRADHCSKNYFEYFDTYIKDTFLSSYRKPYMIIDSEGYFTNLDLITFSAEIEHVCNQVGLDIFLWEIPIVGNTTDKVLDFSNKTDTVIIDNFINDYKKVNSFLNGVDSPLECYDFVTIENFAMRNNLTNVTVYSGFYNVNDYFRSDVIKFGTKDIFVSACCTVEKDVIKVASYDPSIDAPSANSIQHKFICLNKRYESFRQLVAAHLLDKDCLLSYIHKHLDLQVRIQGNTIDIKDWDFYWQDISRRCSFSLNKLFKQYPHLYANTKRLEELDFISVDKHREDASWLILKSDEKWHLPVDSYYSAFCAVVNESTYAFPLAHFADKTLNAIKCHRPFVLVAPPFTLEYLKSLGFKTFDAYWNEDYDKETDHQKRLIKIFEVIDTIENYSIDQCRQMYQDMLYILEHNYKLLSELKG